MTEQELFEKIDLDSFTKDVEDLSKMDESEIYKLIGKSLNTYGARAIEVPSYSNMNFLDNTLKEFDMNKSINPKFAFSGANYRINTSEAIAIIKNPIILTTEDAESIGKNFWNRVKGEIKKELCTNEKIIKLMTEGASLKEYLLIAIPLVATVLTIGTISIPLTVALASIFAIIAKIGYKAYCDI